jgi:hypothetical protein
MLGHESAGLTLDRYGHLYGSDVEAVGVAINALLTRDCGQNVVTGRNTVVPETVAHSACAADLLVEPRRFELLTSALQRQRSTN